MMEDRGGGGKMEGVKKGKRGRFGGREGIESRERKGKESSGENGYGREGGMKRVVSH